jgi:hypothetical protein
MEPALQYESGSLADMLPIYVRGIAYLAVDAPAQAEAEFQKIITHLSVDATTTLYPLSVLGTARCYRLQGKKADRHISRYSDFGKTRTEIYPFCAQRERSSIHLDRSDRLPSHKAAFKAVFLQTFQPTTQPTI